MVDHQREIETSRTPVGANPSSPDQIYDLIVVGAGPAGSNAAAVALQGGLTVAQLDRFSFPRIKPCAGGITPRGINSLQHRPVDASPCREVEFNAWLRRKYQFSHSKPIVHFVYRPEFDHWLIRRNQAFANFEFHDRAKVREIEFRNGLFKVHTSGRDFVGRQLVGADGAYSIVNRTFQISRPQALATAVEVNIYHRDSEYPEVDSASFDYGAISRGYGWVFPKSDHWSVGLYTLEEKLSGIRGLLSDYLKKRGFHLRRDPLEDFHGHRIPVGGYRLNPPTIPVYVTGDAGGFADAVTGEGIFHALESGRLAGETAVGVHRREASPSSYYETLAERILPDTRLSWKLAGAVYAAPEISLLALSRLGIWRPLIQGYSEGVTLWRSLIFPAPLWLRSLGNASAITRKWPSINGKS